jgi:hypothetical protein
VRAAIFLGLANGKRLDAIEIARSRGEHIIADHLKGAINVGTSTGWGSSVVQVTGLGSEFSAYDFGASVLGRIPGTRKLPLKVTVATGGNTSVDWVAEGSPTPVSAGVFATATLGAALLGGIAVITKEVAEFAAPDAEALLNADLTNASVAAMDASFVSPVAAVSGLSPAGILAGATPVISSGTTPALIAADFNTLFAKFPAASVTLRQPVIVMTPATAIFLATLRDSAGGAAFADITVNGGTLFGVPVLTSASVPSSVSGGSIIAVVEGSQVLYGDGGANIDVSQYASLQLDDAPSAGAQPLVSLFQLNLLGVRLQRVVNWALAKAGGAQYIDQFAH